MTIHQLFNCHVATVLLYGLIKTVKKYHKLCCAVQKVISNCLTKIVNQCISKFLLSARQLPCVQKDCLHYSKLKMCWLQNLYHDQYKFNPQYYQLQTGQQPIRTTME
ncbi:Hypothetical_protein [Hexamita inflata]|uniref:Hypothetical_protein n=1 Tax=Hexamita inflata TaxID=28002 RepID=A0AA86QHL4_9EUKA|nr:Hypothetical protein HINF_LOCUS40929 [Hexamita inflata]